MNEQFYLGLFVGCIANTFVVMVGINVLARWAKATFDKEKREEEDEEIEETDTENKDKENDKEDKKKKNRYDPDWWKKGKPPPY